MADDATPPPTDAPVPGPEAPGGPAPRSDPAAEHLASALRTSFRLLSVVMVLGALAFLAMGFRSVRPGEAAIETVFGEVVGVTTEGLAYNWPAPIGEIEKINVGERTIQVDEFWMNETRKDQLQPDLRKRDAPEGGLRPGWDGAVLTGDRNLLHLRLECTYVVTRTGYELPYGDPLAADDPVGAFLRRSPTPDETVAQARRRWRAERGPAAGLSRQLRDADPNALLQAAAQKMTFTCSTHPALLYRLNLQDPNETIRSALTDAGIRAAATRTADSLQRTERAAFESAVASLAQARLDTLRSGVEIRAVKVVHSTWPLRTLPDYDAVQSAVNEAEKAKNTARREATTLLNKAAGPEAVRRFVGDPRYLGAAAGGGEEASGEIDLIGRYNDAVRRGDTKAAAALLEGIDNVLVSDATEGTARRALTDAMSYRTSTLEAVKRRVNSFRELLSAYRRNPEFALERWWVETREEILAYPTAEKHYITPGREKTVLYIGRDSETVQKIDEELLKARKGESSTNKQAKKKD